MILIQGAMEIEIEELKNSLEDIEKKIVDGYEFYLGKLADYPIVISKTEVGMVNSAVATMIGIKEFQPSMIINQGTAGGYGNMIHKGDIVVGTESININSYRTPYRKKEEGANPLDWKLQTFIGGGVDFLEKIEADRNILEFIKLQKKDIEKENLIYGTIGSGDCWNREMDRIEFLNKEYGILCEDMETVSVYKMAKKYDTPVIGIRVIANNEMLEEEYDRTLSSQSQMFAIALCKAWIKEGKE